MLQVITDRLQVYKPIQYNKHTPLNNTAVANRKEWAYFPLLTLQYLLYLIITPLIWDCKGFLKILLNKKRSLLRPFPLAGAEGLEAEWGFNQMLFNHPHCYIVLYSVFRLEIRYPCITV